MTDRKIAPAFREVEKIDLIRAEPHTADNGLKIFVVNGGEQDLIRVEFIFGNVNYDPSRPLEAYATNSMLNEGTSELSSSEIADKIDFYGAFLQTEYSYDHSSVILYSLNKHLASTLPIVRAIISDSIFPQVELDTFIRNQIQKLSVSLEKNDFLSRKIFNNILFNNTLYGYDTRAEDYETLSRTDLGEYFKSAYQPSNCTVVISGRVNTVALDLIGRLFGQDWQTNKAPTPNVFNFNMGVGNEHYFEKADALQSAIRLGKLAVNRSHPDFPGIQVLNTVLGGYFGSRLMANIREDKGYTYGIGSAIVSLQNAGYFFIASEVGADVCQPALDEINKEIQILRKELISEEELSLVRNYMLGSMLGSLENAMSHADKFKNIYFSGLNYDYYQNYIHTVRTIRPATLADLANKYFDTDLFQRVIVGKK